MSDFGQWMTRVDADVESAIGDAEGVWRALLEGNRDLLGRATAEWPASRILLQLAAEQPEGHTARSAADAWLATDGAEMLWLKGPVRAAVPAAATSTPTGPVQFEGHLEGPDEALLLACGNVVSRSEHELMLWDGASGAHIAQCRGQEKKLDGLLTLPEDRFLAISNEPEVPVWSGLTGERVGTLSGCHFGGGVVRGSGTQARLVTWGMAIHVWNLETLALIGTISGGHTLWIRDARLLPDGRLLTWSREKLLAVWDVDELVLDCVLKGHRDDVTFADVLPDGTVASLSEDKNIKLWDVAPNPKKRGKPRKALKSFKTGQKYGREVARPVGS